MKYDDYGVTNMSEIKNIALIPNTERDTQLFATTEAFHLLASCGFNVLIDEALKCAHLCGASFLSADELMQGADMLITLGGDGTILKAAGEAAPYRIPVLGINLGHLGFLTQAERGDIETVADEIALGNFSVSEHMMIRVRVMKDGAEVCGADALNDIITVSGSQKMLSFEVLVDGTVTNKHMADGMIMATSTGSTAYSLSCGGPIVYPELECMVLTPVCPHTLKSRCIILPPDKKVTLRADFEYSRDAEVRADGRLIHRLGEDEYIEAERSEYSARLVNIGGRSFFDVIREKLGE